MKMPNGVIIVIAVVIIAVYMTLPNNDPVLDMKLNFTYDFYNR